MKTKKIFTKVLSIALVCVMLVMSMGAGYSEEGNAMDCESTSLFSIGEDEILDSIFGNSPIQYSNNANAVNEIAKNYSEIRVPFYPYEGDDTQARMAVQKNPIPAKANQVNTYDKEILQSTYKWIISDYDISEEEAMAIAQEIIVTPANRSGGFIYLGEIVNGKLVQTYKSYDIEYIDPYGFAESFNDDCSSRVPEYPRPDDIVVLDEYWLHEPKLIDSTRYVQWYRGWEGFDLYRSSTGGYQTFSDPFGIWITIGYEGTLEKSDARLFGLPVTSTRRIEHDIKEGDREYVSAWTTKQFCPYIYMNVDEYEATYRFRLKNERTGSIYFEDIYFEAANSTWDENGIIEWTRVNDLENPKAPTPQPPLGGAW